MAKKSFSFGALFVATLAATASAQGIDLSSQLATLPFSPNITAACRTAITNGTLLTDVFIGCGGLPLLGIGSDPAQALRTGFLQSFCSDKCKNATSQIGPQYTPVCGDSAIFANRNGPSDTNIWTVVFGGQTATQVTKTFEAIFGVGCFKTDKGDGFCLEEAVKNVDAVGPISKNNTETSLPPFGLLPPVAYANRSTVACTNCIKRQIEASSQYKSLALYQAIEPNLNALQSAINSQCPGGPTQAGGKTSAAGRVRSMATDVIAVLGLTMAVGGLLM
ncbi:hypothetical protein HK102_007693 [Quaeritorhiza haematococci]|nr:hypothetical protein HK102_007693 [Quaeritorhiza haematococci]